MHIFKSAFLARLMLFSILLGTIPVIVLGSLSYLKTGSIVQEKVNEGSMQTMTQTQLKVEQILQMIDNSIIQFINSPLVKESIHMNLSTMDYMGIADLTESLHCLQTYDLGIQEVELLQTGY
ncbi:hypothetical protein [Paenibacillus riograndensis]|uniref:Putative membrane protein n=1 Tax=Paenibacillus riograndensis SBR5 TaxID=1073571 RepID=A0A0E4CX29_9BACL|nr:hypothetical protein [Paenibacillus riograndensis]CQR55924.1 putative membrane protein [Paenibacillus riograndensis SBR5]